MTVCIMDFGSSNNKSKITVQTSSSVFEPDTALGRIEALHSKSELEG
ncbi:MAG: hypothetical protein ACI4I1_12535 [Oscillospiraceae bacterium]